MNTSYKLASMLGGLVISAAASATPIFSSGDNGIFFKNYENLYRAATACAAQECLAAAAGDPAGYLRVNPSLANNVKVNDIFIGVLSVQNIDDANGTIWSSAIGADVFSGYFVQKVVNVSQADPTNATITLGTGNDPFGILQTGEMFRMYTGSTNLFLGGGADVTASINSVTSNTFWGSFGIGSEGFAYTKTDLNTSIFDSNTQAFLALDLMAKGPTYSMGSLNKVNDHNESFFGGLAVAGASQVCTAADLANASVSCTDIVGTSEIESNDKFAGFGGSQPWMFNSNDPFELNRIPEPGSLALAGLALMGLGVARRRSAHKQG